MTHSSSVLFPPPPLFSSSDLHLDIRLNHPFLCLSVDNVLMVIAALLCEQTIVFTSSNYSMPALVIQVIGNVPLSLPLSLSHSFPSLFLSLFLFFLPSLSLSLFSPYLYLHFSITNCIYMYSSSFFPPLLSFSSSSVY